jgi:CHAD domain-containing protein
VTESFVERELKFDVDPGFAVPDVSDLLPSGGTATAGHEQLRSDYYDTPELDLQAVHLTLRRRTGSTDNGWQLKVPDPPFRQEIRVDEVGDEVPAELADLLTGVTAGAPLQLIATLTTHRSTLELLDADGVKLAEIDDDTVHAVVPGDPESTVGWHEVEIELGGEDLDLLDRLGERLSDAGAWPAESPSKLGRALAAAGRLPTPAAEVRTAADVLAGYLAEQRRVIAAGDLALRRGDDSVIHKTRVATRRLRSTLRTFAVLVDEDRAAAADEELRWFAGLMGEIRDRQVLDRRLQAMVEELDDTLVLGPVQSRIHQELARERGEHWDRLMEAMRSQRYLTLMSDVADWVHQPPWTPKAQQPADTLRPLVKRARRKVSSRLQKANRSGDPHALHSARKAAKRARYAAEATAPVLGDAKAAKVAERYEKLQDVLGEHQDSLVSAELLRRLGIIAGTTVGENGFTFGLLHEREEHNARVARKRSRRRAATYT